MSRGIVLYISLELADQFAVSLSLDDLREGRLMALLPGLEGGGGYEAQAGVWGVEGVDSLVLLCLAVSDSPHTLALPLLQVLWHWLILHTVSTEHRQCRENNT